MTNMAFELAQAFNQDLSDGILHRCNMNVFKNSSVLSDTTKGEIHKAFLSNQISRLACLCPN